jgi:hypothetical protein
MPDDAPAVRVCRSPVSRLFGFELAATLIAYLSPPANCSFGVFTATGVVEHTASGIRWLPFGEILFARTDL